MPWSGSQAKKLMNFNSFINDTLLFVPMPIKKPWTYYLNHYEIPNQLSKGKEAFTLFMQK